MKQTKPAQAQSNNKRTAAAVAAACLLLLLGVVITAALLGQRLSGVAPSDEGVIALEPGAGGSSGPGGSGAGEGTGEGEGEGTGSGGSRRPSAGAGGGYAGFYAEDSDHPWAAQTTASIFHVSYDETGEVTVRSENGADDKVFAPGVSADYSFTFKNVGTVALDYTMYINTWIEPLGLNIPIEARVNCYDGTWLGSTGGDWVPVLSLDGSTDTATLAANHYACYTLEWRWPFETVDENGSIIPGDTLDTLLGDMAAGQELTLTIQFTVYAEESADPNASGGLAPRTGDQARLLLWLLLALAAVLVLVLLWLLPVLRRRKQAAAPAADLPAGDDAPAAAAPPDTAAAVAPAPPGSAPPAAPADLPAQGGEAPQS